MKLGKKKTKVEEVQPIETEQLELETEQLTFEQDDEFLADCLATEDVEIIYTEAISEED